jgi:hypothetical protein
VPYLTIEEHERGAYLLPLVEDLVRRVAADGVGDPIAALRAAVGDPDAATAPLLAVARGVDLAAIRWASEIESLRIVHDHADGTRMRLVIRECLNRIARVEVSRPPDG